MNMQHLSPLISDSYEIWHTGSGNQIKFDQIMTHINAHTSLGGKVFIGTDSMLRPGSCVFATAICLHGSTGQSGGRYFFKRETEKDRDYTNLNSRMLKEVQESIEMAGKIVQTSPEADVEIHIDVGTSERSKTRRLVETLKGWTVAAGFPCKVKPYAWASASVADRHTK